VHILYLRHDHAHDVFPDPYAMCFQTRVARVQKVVRDVISEWEPLLVFLEDRQRLFGITPTETICSFIHRVRTEHVWTQGLTEEDFVDQVNDNNDIRRRVEQQLSFLTTILGDLTDMRHAITPSKDLLTLNVLSVYKILFPLDQRNHFAVSDSGAMYQTLRTTRLSSSQEGVLAPWPLVRPNPSDSRYL
jgi:hypothetical protein